MSSRDVWTIVGLVPVVVAMVPALYLCVRSFMKSDEDASAKRWILFLKIAIPLFVIGGILYIISDALSWVYLDQGWVMQALGYLCKMQAHIFIFATLVEVALWLSLAPNGSAPAANNTVTRYIRMVLPFVGMAFSFVLTALNITYFGLYVEMFAGEPRTLGERMKINILRFACSMILLGLNIILLGICITILVKAKNSSSVRSASKFLVAAASFNVLPMLWLAILEIIMTAATNEPSERFYMSLSALFSVASYTSWLPSVISLCILHRLRSRKLDDPATGTRKLEEPYHSA